MQWGCYASHAKSNAEIPSLRPECVGITTVAPAASRSQRYSARTSLLFKLNLSSGQLGQHPLGFPEPNRSQNEESPLKSCSGRVLGPVDGFNVFSVQFGQHMRGGTEPSFRRLINEISSLACPKWAFAQFGQPCTNRCLIGPCHFAFLGMVPQD